MKKKNEIIKNQILAHKNKVHKIFSEHYISLKVMYIYMN